MGADFFTPLRNAIILAQDVKGRVGATGLDMPEQPPCLCGQILLDAVMGCT